MHNCRPLLGRRGGTILRRPVRASSIPAPTTAVKNGSSSTRRGTTGFLTPLSSPTLGADGTIYSTPGDDNLYVQSERDAQVDLPAAPANGRFTRDRSRWNHLRSFSQAAIFRRLFNAVNPDGTLKWTFQTSFPVSLRPPLPPMGQSTFTATTAYCVQSIPMAPRSGSWRKD